LRFYKTAPLLQEVVLLLLAIAVVVQGNGRGDGYCHHKRGPTARPHTVTITEFGAVGDGVTSNTLAFQNAVFYLRSFADKGGAQLYVPKGRWLTGSFNLTSHLTLFLDKDAVIVGNSCSNFCIQDCSISVGHDAIAVKSGWDKYGISFNRPSSNIHINNVHLQTSLGSALAFGSEMSGGISDVQVEQLYIHDSFTAIEFKTTRGRGGYIEDIIVSDVEMENVHEAFQITGHCGAHPDDQYDPDALPVIKQITIKDVVGTNISIAGTLSGIDHGPFTAICLANISLSVTSGASNSWICSNVSGFSESVVPQPCSDLSSNSSLSCFSLENFNALVDFQ
ncbi:hypothetical protein GW17_00026812, partial [Ensete ventricosum]